MRKLSLLWALLLVVFVAGCSWWWNKEKEAEGNNVTNGINVEVCNKYFGLVDCIIDNDIDSSYSAEDREVIRASVKDMRESWATLDEYTVTTMCTKELSRFESEEMKEYLSQIGCALD